MAVVVKCAPGGAVGWGGCRGRASNRQFLGAPSQIQPLMRAIWDDGRAPPVFGIWVPEQMPVPVSLFMRWLFATAPGLTLTMVVQFDEAGTLTKLP